MTRCVGSPAPRITGLARVGLDGAPVTVWLLAANLLVYVAQVAYARDLHMLSGMAAADPAVADRLSRQNLAFGVNYAPFVFGEWRVETLLTSCFVHFSLLHIFFNMALLAVLGSIVERTVGAARYASMYVASGIVGAATSASWGWFYAGAERASAGASGALCGVFAAALVLGVRLQGWRGPTVRSMAFWLALTIGLGWWFGTDNAAHLGGAASGLAFALGWRDGVVHSVLRARLSVGISAALVVGAAATVLVRDAVDPWATMDVDARIAYAEAALNRASCPDAIFATERAARILPHDSAPTTPPQIARVRELKRIILVGCRPSP
jgi:rhomboid protease GluP